MNALYRIAHDVEPSVLAMWGDFLLKGTVLLILALIAIKSLRKASASLRYLMMTLMVGMIPIMLVASFQDYPVRVATWDYSESIMEGSHSFSATKATSTVVAEETTPDFNPATTAEETSPWLDRLAVESREPEWKLRDYAGLLFVIWVVGVVVVMMGLLIRMTSLWRYGRRLHQFPVRVLTESLEKVCRKLQISHVPRLLMGESRSPIMTWGVWRHTIVMPPETSEWTASRIESVLIHELAHIKRRDFLVSIVHRCSLNLLWFHPLVIYVRRHLSLARESACDDVAINHVAARGFAEDLLSIAAGDGKEKVGLAMGMGLGKRSVVQQRIRALFSNVPHRVEVRKAERLIAMGIGAVLMISSVMTGCQTTEVAYQGLPLGPRQEEFEETLMPRVSSTTVITSSAATEGPQLRIITGETSTFITDQNRDYVNTLPEPISFGLTDYFPIRMITNIWVKQGMTFSGHRVMTAKEAVEFLSISDGMISPFLCNNTYEHKTANARAGSEQFVTYHKAQEFYDKPKPGEAFDMEGEPIANPYPDEIDLRELGVKLHISGRIQRDRETILLSIEYGYRLFDGFRYNEDRTKELPVYLESNYQAEVEVENGGLVILAGPLHEQWNLEHLPLVGSLFSKPQLEQIYQALVIQVEIVDPL